MAPKDGIATAVDTIYDALALRAAETFIDRSNQAIVLPENFHKLVENRPKPQETRIDQEISNR